MNQFETHADDLLGRASAAAEILRTFDQAQVDRIVEAIFKAAFDARITLAQTRFRGNRHGAGRAQGW